MKYLVSWSGGYDSTFLICKLLSEGHQVHGLYTSLLNNEQKTKRELQAIDDLYENYFKNYNFTYSKDSSVNIHGNCNLSLKQPILFLTSLLYSSGGYDKVAIGYVLNDCAISFLPELNAIWNSYKMLSNDKIPDLEFPLIKVDKTTTVSSIPYKIKKYITWCESPVESNLPCGVCAPCKKMSMHELFPNFSNDSVKEDECEAKKY